MTIGSVAALLVASVACAIDIRERRIPNVLTLGTAALGLLYRLGSSGVDGVMTGMTGCLLGMALLILPYALGGLGAGDVKLLGALGAWLGPQDVFWVAMYTGLAGGVLALIVAFARGYLRQAWLNVWLLLTHWRVMGLRPMSELTLETSQGPRLAYAVPILAGTIVTIWLR